jgi:hypothetical protein
MIVTTWNNFEYQKLEITCNEADEKSINEICGVFNKIYGRMNHETMLYYLKIKGLEFKIKE